MHPLRVLKGMEVPGSAGASVAAVRAAAIVAAGHKAADRLQRRPKRRKVDRME
jgi:hypothetical protein